MKKLYFIASFLLVSLFSINAAKAQNPHFTDTDPFSARIVGHEILFKGTIAGLGNKYKNITFEINATLSTDADCLNRGGNDPCENGNRSTRTAIAFIYSPRNGRVTFTEGNTRYNLGNLTSFANCVTCNSGNFGTGGQVIIDQSTIVIKANGIIVSR